MDLNTTYRPTTQNLTEPLLDLRTRWGGLPQEIIQIIFTFIPVEDFSSVMSLTTRCVEDLSSKNSVYLNKVVEHLLDQGQVAKIKRIFFNPLSTPTMGERSVQVTEILKHLLKKNLTLEINLKMRVIAPTIFPTDTLNPPFRLSDFGGLNLEKFKWAQALVPDDRLILRQFLTAIFPLLNSKKIHVHANVLTLFKMIAPVNPDYSLTQVVNESLNQFLKKCHENEDWGQALKIFRFFQHNSLRFVATIEKMELLPNLIQLGAYYLNDSKSPEFTVIDTKAFISPTIRLSSYFYSLLKDVKKEEIIFFEQWLAAVKFPLKGTFQQFFLDLYDHAYAQENYGVTVQVAKWILLASSEANASSCVPFVYRWIQKNYPFENWKSLIPQLSQAVQVDLLCQLAESLQDLMTQKENTLNLDLFSELGQLWCLVESHLRLKQDLPVDRMDHEIDLQKELYLKFKRSLEDLLKPYAASLTPEKKTAIALFFKPFSQLSKEDLINIFDELPKAELTDFLKIEPLNQDEIQSFHESELAKKANKVDVLDYLEYMEEYLEWDEDTIMSEGE